ncbi:hypothetical protein M885DRAFT_519331 [Pelagophyceae sp. CCMP2097]|nr:hypothetical protein M885DRAFT_519331 [Pelagophyceae sp. CCMP2097]
MSGIVYASRNKYLVGDDRAMTAMRRQYRRGCAESALKPPTFYCNRDKVARHRLQLRPITPYDDDCGPRHEVPASLRNGGPCVQPRKAMQAGRVRQPEHRAPPAPTHASVERKVSYLDEIAKRREAQKPAHQLNDWHRTTQCGVDFWVNSQTGAAQEARPSLAPEPRRASPEATPPPAPKEDWPKKDEWPYAQADDGIIPDDFAFLAQWRSEKKPPRW